MLMASRLPQHAKANRRLIQTIGISPEAVLLAWSSLPRCAQSVVSCSVKRRKDLSAFKTLLYKRKNGRHVYLGPTQKCQ
eukprot:601563-Amphidinium_carterae.1